MIILQSCDLAGCVTLELASSFFKIKFFIKLWKGIVHYLLKGGVLKGNHVVITYSSAYNIFGKCLPAMFPM